MDFKGDLHCIKIRRYSIYPRYKRGSVGFRKGLEKMKYVLEVVMLMILIIVVPVIFCLILWAVVIHIQRPREQRRDTYTPLSPTLQWMNTAGSILLANNNGNFRYMAGVYFPGSENDQRSVEGIKTTLWEYWGIQGHESAMDEMTHLVRSGMRVQYGSEMRKLEVLYHGCSEEELIAAAQKENPKADEDSFLPKMLMAYRRYGENALLGWDMGRAAYITQWCYFVGYISMEEMLDIVVDAGKIAQEYFQNWEEMMESYLLGGQYWMREDASDPKSMTAERWKIYEALWKGEKPYKNIPYTTIAFDTPLSKEIITNKYGIMPEYEQYYKTKDFV